MTFLDKTTLAYPASGSLPGRFYQRASNPTSANFKEFQIGDIWINPGVAAFILIGKTATLGTWQQMAASGTGILTLTGNSGGAISADGSNNIGVIGTGQISISGNAGAHELTATIGTSIATSYATDSGTATPSSNVITFTGLDGLTTLGSGSAVTIDAGPTILRRIVPDLGSIISPSLQAINLVGGNLMSTTGVGNTVQLNASAAVAASFPTDSGTATPNANALTIAGGIGITTSASGTTVTITANQSEMWTEVTVVGPTTMSVNGGYIASNAVAVQLLLPSVAPLGSIVEVAGKGAGGWMIKQNAGQVIAMGSAITTTGATGSVASTLKADSIKLLCITANTTWIVLSGTGNYTFV